MTLPVSPNAISLSQVNTELGLSATATISMNDAAVRTLFGKAGSGTTISMSDGYGKSNTFTFSFAGGSNINLRTQAINAGWDGFVKLFATNSGTITSTSTSLYALVISGSFPNGVEFTNNGLIVGRGGDGGFGYAWTYSPGPIGATSGSAGGPGMYIGDVGVGILTIYNNGTIAGGGGGGGGGAGYNNKGGVSPGGGGGGGIGGSLGGNGGTRSGTYYSNATNGVNGTTTAAGSGGIGGNPHGGARGDGGAGGGYASSGSSGQSTDGTGGTAGIGFNGGNYIGGFSALVTWGATGNRY